MITYKLIRFPEVSQTTFGILFDENQLPFAATVEREWKDNKKDESCIPLDAYECKRIDSPQFGNTFEVTNVKGRSHILFHKGNTVYNTKGCIILGKQFGYVARVPGVLYSGIAFSEFMERLKSSETFKLIIEGTNEPSKYCNEIPRGDNIQRDLRRLVTEVYMDWLQKGGK